MKKFFTLIAVAALAFAAQANVLTVCDNGAQGYHAPIYGLYYDTEGTISQMIYPADMLAEMEGAEITQIKFFAVNPFELTGGNLQLSLAVVDQDCYEEAVAIEGATAVAYSPVNTGETELVFELAEPFVYTGGNLMIETKVIMTGNWKTTIFWGMIPEDETFYPAMYSYASYWGTSAYLENFLPKAEFTYEAGDVPPVDPEDPHMTGYWAVFTNPEGVEDWVNLINGYNDEYVNTVTLSKGTYGTFNPEDESTRPLVPVYIVINGVRYGAEVDLTPAAYGQASANPLVEGENFYTLPAGYQYSVGVSVFLDGSYGLYVAQGAMTDVDELVAGKTVAGVRYFNAAGQEMSEANGLTIMVTTYTDGTTSTVKVIK